MKITLKQIVKKILKKLFKPVLQRYYLILDKLDKLDKLDYIINKLSLVDGIVELKEAKFWVPNAPRDFIQNTHLSRSTFFELDILKDIDKYLNKNSVVVDIGANVGNHTVYWGKTANVKRIYSFEPVKTVFNILKKNVEINNLNEKVGLYNIGLSDTKTMGTIEEYNADNIGGTMICKSDGGDMELDKLDNIKEIIGEPVVDFIKIDVEKMEQGVLNGAEQFFKKHKPIVFIESFDGKNQYDFTYSFFKGLGYDEPIKYPSYNYLFIHKDSKNGSNEK
jgi:FkbM family methyltransferase